MTGAPSAAMQANAQPAVREEGAGTTWRVSGREGLGLVPGTVLYATTGVLWRSEGTPRRSWEGVWAARLGSRNRNSHATWRFRFRCRLLASQVRTTPGMGWRCKTESQARERPRTLGPNGN